MDLSAYQATVDGVLMDLTRLEFELLKFLATHRGTVYTREMLLSLVWGEDYYGGTRTVDVHVRRLRAKLGERHEDLIQTVRGVGYRFEEG
jgi:DNA-binding response OmpR family regulator